MVIEELLPPKQVEKKPWEAFPLGLGLAVLGILLGALFFRVDAALMGIVLITVASVPFLMKVLDIEEVHEEKAHTLMQLFLRNKKIITIYFVFFLGIATGYFILYMFFPGNLIQSIFDAQTSLFANAQISTVLTAGFDWTIFDTILRNNMGIILLCMVLSFLYGAGAVLVLTWNASVLGIFLASLAKIHLIAFVTPHVVLEFLAYFLAAVSGGLISVVISKHKLGSRPFRIIIADSLILLVMSMGFVIAGALVETFAISLLA